MYTHKNHLKWRSGQPGAEKEMSPLHRCALIFVVIGVRTRRCLHSIAALCRSTLHGMWYRGGVWISQLFKVPVHAAR